jgi:hypothetical protein
MFNLTNIPLNSDPKSRVTSPAWIQFFLSLGETITTISSISWGNIVGTLANQNDLQGVLSKITPPSTMAIKKGDGTGGFIDAIADVDYATPNANTLSLATHASLETGVHGAGAGVLLSSSRMVSYQGNAVFYDGDAVYI